MPISQIYPSELQTRLAAGGVRLIDVRTPGEFAAGHVPGAVNMPLDRLDPKSLAGAGPVHVICQSGVRSRQAAEQLAAAGIAEIIDVSGGTGAWKAAGLPLAGSGAQVFGVERQVRCIIGVGVLAGAILALTVNPWFALLSGFFGAGLLMAGITDLCPLAIAVAAMPWNRSVQPSSGACCAPAADKT